MTLKRIELAGFKSFAKKTTLEFNTPVTAIVGPNGSGKSNVVEAIRFVLGEQSIKSLRGKAGVDLIFKGSKALSSLSRAGVTIVFDNRDKIFTFGGSDQKNVSLDFDEVSLSREVYSDGANKYLINNTEVRLKDIVELLGSVHIGSSGHHIISQGEADRILSANAKDRRAMIEDALGLKVYQYKIRESEKKLEKTEQNMKEVQSLRREIAPHIGFLKKQVEKLEKAREMRTELVGLYTNYFGKELSYVRLEKARLHQEKQKEQAALSDLSHKVGKLEAGRTETTNIEDPNILNKEDALKKLAESRDELSRKLGRLEGSIDALTRPRAMLKKEDTGKQFVRLYDIEEMIHSIDGTIASALDSNNLMTVVETLKTIRTSLKSFVEKQKGTSSQSTDEQEMEEPEELKELKNALAPIKTELSNIDQKTESVRKEIDALRLARSNAEANRRNNEREYYELVAKRSEYEGALRMLSMQAEVLTKTETDLAEEIKEAIVLVGREGIVTDDKLFTKDTIGARSEQEDLRKKIERIKIKLEDSGGIGGNDVLKEYDEVTTRDQFLARELIDLADSIKELRALIRDLKFKLDTEFKEGIEKINKQFRDFFALMFGGGSAFLSVVVEHKRPSKENDEEEISSLVEEDLQFERGIEINVSLPHKKVKDLHMLSGGERSLTSIALLFAMSQVNPPPFLVLDETDAALDEANSRKYGNMIESLSKYSQLVVVTHNRETMSRAQVLYGVTIGADGGSKLLSIKFDEAVQIAK